MKIGFLFAGQGAQYASMGKTFYETFESARQIYDQSEQTQKYRDLCFHAESDVLNQTENAQPCILLTSLAIAQVLKDQGVTCECVAGLSLGEYSALAYSNVIDYSDALEIVSERGRIMQNALTPGTSSMAAVLSLDIDLIESVLSSVDGVTIANYNAPNQTVITGLNEPMQKGIEALKEAGIKKIIPLKVSGAFHSPLLNEASYELKEVLENYRFHTPEIPVVYNIFGHYSNESIIDILVQQIQSSVKFKQSIEFMIEEGIDTFIEIGPGKTLSSFVKKISKDVVVLSVDQIEDVKQVLEVVNHE